MLAEFHAFQANANQPCWSCTQGASVPATLPAHGELWNNSVDFYQGQTISRLDVAALGQNAPVPPGITQLPPAGDYYASPALAALLKTVPADQLGQRFPGTMIGTIGQAGLSGPGDLAIYIGHTTAQVNAIPGTEWVTSIDRAPGQEVFSPFFRYAFGVGALAVVFPMLVLISTATRLAANRREERFAALVSLRRVQISPVGVSRRATPKPPGYWRLGALVIGLGVYAYGLSRTTTKSIGASAYPGLILTMIGLVIAGPLLTEWAARLFGRTASGSSALLAARRIADNPKGAFRAVSGLVLAVFLGTMVGALVPAVNATESTPTAGALSNILIGQIGLPAPAGQHLISGIGAIPGASVFPLYSTGGSSLDIQSRGYVGLSEIAVSCAVMREIAVLGQCAPGVKAVQTTDDSLFDDNPMFNIRPIVSTSDPAYTGSLTTLPLQTVLVRVNSPTTLEQVRTYAAAIAYGTSITAFLRLAPRGTTIPQLGHDYYTIMGIGLVAAFGVITVTLPMLRRMTAPSTIRFE